MPGLYALSSWEALPLKSSRVKACANGYALSIAAHLVYTNPREEPVEGIFIYPLEESEVVAGFEAAAGSRRVTFQVQSRHRAQDCCLECRTSPGRPRRCAAGDRPGLPPPICVPPPGLESPTHALRADADPWATSATTTCVTLAERHRYDRDVEIILYPCGKGCWCLEEPWV
uniref:VIT domain-containing protein n=1 Tax=Anas zonorhyncha TaxID=75864 RepID=A0A8B9UJE4_9AVES